MKTRHLYLLSAAMLVSIPLAAPAYAQGETAAQQHNFSIPAGRLSQSVLALSEQAGVQVVFDSDATGSVTGNAVSGKMALGDALNRLVSGTGVSWRWLRNGVVTIESVGGAGADGERVAGVVNVEGAQGSPGFGGAGQMAGVNGINGSRDITATEGTGSFTSGAISVGGKTVKGLDETPRAVSVLTNERIEQQNITSFDEAMAKLPGITLETGGTGNGIGSTTNLDINFYSRGFRVNNVQFDGGAPLTLNNQILPMIDMAIYDHVELLRGADGLFSGYGDPAGTVNLVRKKPLDHGQVLAEAQIGSWNNYRATLDVSSPLAFEGKLRTRVVTVYQDQDYFYDTAKSSRLSIYAVADADLSDSTLLTAGVSYSKQDAVPWSGGLPRYLSGADLELPRSTCFCFSWNKWNFQTTEIFGALEQKIGEDWKLDLRATRVLQHSQQKMGNLNGPVNDVSGQGPRLSGAAFDFGGTQLLLDGDLSGTFEFLGQSQELLIGANWQRSNADAFLQYGALSGFPNYEPVDFPNFDPDLYPEPGVGYPYIRNAEQGMKQFGAYMSFLFTPIERLHIGVASRYTWIKNKRAVEYLCTSIYSYPEYNLYCNNVGDVNGIDIYEDTDSELAKPTVTVSYDFSKNIKVHLTYTDIYRSQITYLMEDGSPLPPMTGNNIEASLKYVSDNKKLNGSVSVYQVKQSNMLIYTGYQSTPPGYYCCYAIGNGAAVSKGLDLEVAGEILPGWQISAGYTYNHSNYVGSDNYPPDYDGPRTPLVSRAPEHLLKLWTSFSFEREGWLKGVTISGGLQAQTKAYYSGYTCTEYGIDPITQQPSSDCLAYADYAFTVKPYALASLRIEKQLTEDLNLSVAVDNLADKTYYQTVGNASGGNWYGQPRSFTATLRGKW